MKEGSGPARGLGLCGGHRVGKTTLAEALSRVGGIPFVRTGTSAVFERHGLDPAEPMPFATRLLVQHEILSAAEKAWREGSGAFITDRTPVDMMAYTLGDIRGDTEVRLQDLDAYLERCFRVTNELFSTLIVVQPGIPLVPDEGKAALNEAYIEHINALVLGLCHDQRLRCRTLLLEREVTTLDARVARLMSLLDLPPDRAAAPARRTGQPSEPPPGSGRSPSPRRRRSCP
ncbi:AAA family ATPase [Nitrospira sp. Kam-Ns4a]